MAESEPYGSSTIYTHQTLGKHRNPTKEEIPSGLDVDFDKLIESLNQLRKRDEKLFPDNEFERYATSLEKLPDEVVKKSFQKMVKRITDETDAFHEWEETGMVASLLEGFDQGKFRESIRFLEKLSLRDWRIWYDRFIKHRQDADSVASTTYSIGKPSVRVFGASPSPKGIWQILAGLNQPNNPLTSIKHELTHVAQGNPRNKTFYIGTALGAALGSISSIIIGKLMGREVGVIGGVAIGLGVAEKFRRRTMKIKSTLTEIHAFKAHESLEPNELSTKKLVEELKALYFDDPKQKQYVDQLIMGAVAVDTLRALGLNDKKIGELVRASRWDNKNFKWIELEQKINELANEYRLAEDDVENLVLADRLERKIENLRAQIIAGEELKKLVDETQFNDLNIHIQSSA